MIRIGTLDWGQKEREAIQNIISPEDPQLTMGPKVRQFENMFAKWIGSKYAVSCNSGTSALMIAIKAVKLRYLADVFQAITTSLTYPATYNALIHNDFSIDEKDIDASFNMKLEKPPYPALMVPVHLFGKYVKGIEDVSSHKNYVVEDACQALGSSYKNKKLGTFGVCGVFSFFPAHQITTVEGGMIVTDDEKIMMTCRSLRDNGRLCTCPICTLKTNGVCKKRTEYEGEIRWATEYCGYNMKMTEFQGVLGVVKMKKINSICERRNEIYRIYSTALREMGPYQEEHEYVVPLAYPIVVSNPKKTVLCLAKNDIEARGMYPHQGTNCPNAKHLSSHSLFLPAHHNLTDSDVHYIIEKVKKCC